MTMRRNTKRLSDIMKKVHEATREANRRNMDPREKPKKVKISKSEADFLRAIGVTVDERDAMNKASSGVAERIKQQEKRIKQLQEEEEHIHDFFGDEIVHETKDKKEENAVNDRTLPDAWLELGDE